MSKRRLSAREKFRWRGWEFRLERVTSVEARWHMQDGKIKIRLIYRDIQDPETPPEYSAYIVMQGLGVAGSGVSLESADQALALAERDFFASVVGAVRMVRQLKIGKVVAAEPETPPLDQDGDSKVLSQGSNPDPEP